MVSSIPNSSHPTGLQGPDFIDGAAESAKFISPVRLLLHGAEDRSLGGPSVRVPRSAAALREIGVPAQVSNFSRASEIEEDMVHLFNVWPPESALRSLHQLKAAGKRVVFSPIYLNFGEQHIWSSFAFGQDLAVVSRYLQNRGRLSEIIPGYHAMVREMLSLADHVIYLSKVERAALDAIGATMPPERTSLVYNPVDAALWQGGDPALFRSAYSECLGDADYVICIGRIEPRKNQLALARAIRGLPLRLVLAGHEADLAYAAQIRQEAGAQLILPGRLTPGGDMLRSALVGARAFVLPSWAEGASLAALEAAAAGVSLILSDRSSEREYFGDLAWYCNPADPIGLRDMLSALLTDKEAKTRAVKLQAHVAKTLDWGTYARATQAAYSRAAAMPKNEPKPSKLVVQARPTLALDLTALTRAEGVPLHNLHCIETLAKALLSLDAPPRAIFWSPERHCFLDLPNNFLTPAQARRYAARTMSDHSLQPVVLPDSATILALSGVWGCDVAHLRGLEDLKALSGCGLVAMVEDVGPCLRPDLFDPVEAADYKARVHRLACLADCLVAPSIATASDINQALENELHAAQLGTISVVPLPALPNSLKIPDPALRARFENVHFALVPGPVTMRGNLNMLTRIWARFAISGAQDDLHLVIAGGIAGDGAKLADSITRDSRVAERIHLLTVENADLDWLYQKALVTLCPSESEGWGWPVIESLARGTPCLVADIPVLTDPAQGTTPDTVKVIDPDDLPAWQQSIESHTQSRLRGSRQNGPSQKDEWIASAQALAKLARQPRSVTLARPLWAGEIAPAGIQASPQVIRFGKGWHPAKNQIRWAAGESAEIWLNADEALRPGQDHMLLHLRFETALSTNQRARLRVTSGGTCLYDAPVTGLSLPQDIFLSIPVMALDETGSLPLTLHLPTVALPITTTDAKGNISAEFTELRGIGLVSTTLLDIEYNNPLAVLQHPDRWSEGQLPQEINFALEEHRALVAPDLHFSASWGFGSLRPSLTLFLQIVPGADRQTLELTLRPVATEGCPGGASIFWNGRLLTRAEWTTSETVRLVLQLEQTDFLAAPAVLEIVPVTLATPADLGLGHEDTIAGLGLFNMALTPFQCE